MAGYPIWYELLTPGPADAAPFYKAVLGWDIPAQGAAPPHGAEYRMIYLSDGSHQGGVLTLRQAMVEGGARPGWLPYFDVDDVDACCAHAREMGAHIWMVQETPGVGTMAMLSDPQGAPFYIMKPIPPEGDPDAQSGVFMPDRPGHACWNELSTAGAAEQEAFYTALFDWEISGEMPMPGDHTYRFVSMGDKGIGAIGSMKPDDMPDAWLVYYRVADIAAAHAAVTDHGGSVVWGPHEVPGDDIILVVRDPSGAALGLAGRKAA